MSYEGHYICDKCGDVKEKYMQEIRVYDWSDRDKNLCKKCLKELKKWFKESEGGKD